MAQETSGGAGQPARLDPSELGTKEYWDALYAREIDNHTHDPTDTGTAWFDDSDAEARMIDYLEEELLSLLLPPPPPPPADDSHNPSSSSSSENRVPQDDSEDDELKMRRLKSDTTFLDLGTGNGSLLFSLRDGGWASSSAAADNDDEDDGGAGAGAGGKASGPGPHMLGVDYSERSVEFARRLRGRRPSGGRVARPAAGVDGDASRARAEEPEAAQDVVGGGEDGEAEFDVRFVTHDILSDPPSRLLLLPATRNPPSGAAQEQPQRRRGWDVVLDKGTFDAVSLSAKDDDGAARYRAAVLPLVRPGGIFLITSCNWTEDELKQWFAAVSDGGQPQNPSKQHTDRDGDGNDWAFEQVGRVRYPSFSFGGVQGQTISTLCFRKVAAAAVKA